MTDNKSIVPLDWDKELIDREIPDVRIGDQLIDRDGHVYTITDYKIGDYNAPCFVCKYHWGTTSIKFDEVSLNGKHAPRYRKLYADVDTVFDDAISVIKTPEDDPELDETTTSLSVVSSQAVVDAHKRMLQQKENRLAVMEWVMKRKMWALQNQASIMERQLNYTKQIIRLMELFLGIYEKMVTIRDGEPAPIETPIAIRQLVLFMDEEVGTIRYNNDQRGIDFQSIDEFDAWLLEDQSHLDQVLPELKGIVALRPSRQQREYSSNFLVNISLQEQNEWMYLLIRNGEQLYRVFTDLKIGGMLYPTAEEMTKIMEELEAATEGSHAEEQARNKEIGWKYIAAVLQGLIERTQAFQPLPANVSLFNAISFEKGHIVLVRDAEIVALPDGMLSFKEWKERANSAIEVGSRVIITDAAHHSYAANSGNKGRHYWAWRYGDQYSGDSWLPSPPENGVYVVVETKMKREYYWSDPTPCFKIMYMPNNAYTWSGYERKRRQGFWIKASDEFVLNYEAFDLDAIRYYVNNRLHRVNYLHIIPQMFNLRDMRLAEIEEERQLVENFAARYDVPEDDVWNTLEWWKTKNKLQRPMREDEAKAWRMIRNRLGVKD